MVDNKKGVIEVQFNWIFILIVGGIILIFFFSIIMKQSDVSKQKISSSIAFDMASIFKGAQISKDTEHPVDIPPLDLFFECDDTSQYSSYRVSQSEQVLGNSLVIFSPDTIIGDSRKMITWATDWNVPFRVMNFLYLTSDTARYVVVEDQLPATIDMQKLYDDLPDLIFKEYITMADYDASLIEDKNNYKVKFIRTVDTSTVLANLNVPVPLQSMQDKAVSMVVIEPVAPTSSFDGWGKVHFYKKSGNVFALDNTSFYVGQASLYGAIYSEDVGSYRCNMNKAFQRLGIVTNVYIDRSNAIINYFSSTPGSDTQNCQSYITNAITELTSIYNVLTLNETGASQLFSSGVGLEDKNKLILRYSCPVIY